MNINADQVEWIVNSKGELGVKVFNRCFFLYKGYSLEYKETAPEIKYRPVGKREFGETCWPQHWVTRGYRDATYEVCGTYVPGISDGKPEDYQWKQLLEPPKNTVEKSFPLPDPQDPPKEVAPVPRVNPYIPDPGSVWVHTNGNEYTVLMLVNPCSERQEEDPTTVVYQGSNGRVWFRPLVDWFRSMTPKEMKS